jgi:hypothetical protein
MPSIALWIMLRPNSGHTSSLVGGGGGTVGRASTWQGSV